MTLDILQAIQSLAKTGKPDGNAEVCRRVLNVLASEDDDVAKCVSITRWINRIPNAGDQSNVVKMVFAVLGKA